MTKRKNKITAADHIEMMPIGLLKPYERNPRTHTSGQVAAIVAAIQEFGFTNPILIDETGVIVAGHGRLAAAQKLGLETVPVIVLDHLSPAQRRAYVIADNQIAAQAGWDDDLLAAELAHLDELDFDLGVLGFSDEDLADLLPSDEAPAPPPREPAKRRQVELSPGAPLNPPGAPDGPDDDHEILRYAVEVPDTDLRPRIVDLLNEIAQLGAVVVRG